MSIIWLALFILMVIIEALTLKFMAICFSGGAIIGFAMALAGISDTVQLWTFCIVTFVLLIFVRPAIIRFINKRHAADSKENGSL